jgi:hypothetical protein
MNEERIIKKDNSPILNTALLQLKSTQLRIRHLQDFAETIKEL